MKNGCVIWLIFIICAAACGYWAGRHHAVPAASMTTALATPSNPSHPDLPPVTAASASATGKADDAPPGKMSLADIEAGLLVLKSKGIWEAMIDKARA